MLDGNLEALRVHEAQIEENEKRYEEMMKEIEDVVGVELQELYEATSKIITSHGFDVNVQDIWKEFL